GRRTVGDERESWAALGRIVGADEANAVLVTQEVEERGHQDDLLLAHRIVRDTIGTGALDAGAGHRGNLLYIINDARGRSDLGVIGTGRIQALLAGRLVEEMALVGQFLRERGADRHDALMLAV